MSQFNGNTSLNIPKLRSNYKYKNSLCGVLINAIKIKNLVNLILSEAKKSKKKSGFIFVTTTKNRGTNFILLPLRRTHNLVCGAATVYDLQTVNKIIKQIDGKIDYILIDGEQKLPNQQNFVISIYKNVSKSKVLTFKGNDSTADAADALLAYLLPFPEKKKMAVIGVGNIGSKVALKLVERGYDVFVGRSKSSDAKQIANAINLIKPKYCLSIAKAKKLSEIAKNMDVLIGFSAGIPVISKKMILQMNKNGLILDGGLGTVNKNAISAAQKKNIKIIRLDIRAGFAATAELLFETKTLVEETMGSIKYCDINIIAGGLYGKIGDAVVDSITRPTQFIGFSDGMGELIWHSYSLELKRNEKIVKHWLHMKSKKLI